METNMAIPQNIKNRNATWSSISGYRSKRNEIAILWSCRDPALSFRDLAFAVLSARNALSPNPRLGLSLSSFPSQLKCLLREAFPRRCHRLLNIFTRALETPETRVWVGISVFTNICLCHWTWVLEAAALSSLPPHTPPCPHQEWMMEFRVKPKML